ncbi:uncharacterized protein BDR25DRAFT_97482 [Lindgomyces ingoldianus]|uniref:Uncharacterized protein n=1 Tax=Lindgomyces ingoldianus TaxID=673940 RepID=A0ACB6QB92_9PLEO|nr:uncharacterized protein BDR25DRAFT_97482 [Lindgomyces ingoldianus]KAF2464239.1 hypothetical protein BDR25DRAFT_97482 [Lindgomyces ingoldianus]
MDSPNVELLSALATLLQNGKYSDLTIVCGMKRYSVHRALVCSRSEFFDGACRNSFKESETGVIDLTEDDAEAVEHMVHYFYHLDYLNKPLSRRSSQRSSRPTSPTTSRLPTRRRTKKLNLLMVEDPLLATMAAASAARDPMTPPDEQPNHYLESIDSAKFPDTPMEQEFEEDPFETAQAEPESNVEKPYLVTHAKVYAIAEKYGISGLKSLARKKFAHQIELHFSSSELPEACQEAYETTVDSDRGLRDVIIQTFRAHPELSLRKDVELAVRETPSLAFELFRMASGLPVFS